MEYDLSGHRVLVTGATGLMGGALCRRLRREGIELRALVRNADKSAALAREGVEVVKGDMTDPNSLRRAVQGCQVVFHFAAILDEFLPLSSYFAVNVQGTQALAQAALEAGVERFVHAGTVSVYDLMTKGRVDETSRPVRRPDAYAATKLEADTRLRTLVSERGLGAVIVQPTQVYGPEDRAWTGRPMQMIREGRLILVGGGRGLLSPIYIDDAVDGVLAAARRGRPGEAYILAGPTMVTVGEFFGALADMVGSKRPPSVPAWLATIVAGFSEALAALRHRRPVFTRGEVLRVSRRVTYDAAKAARELGFSASTTFQEGLRRVAAAAAAGSERAR